MHRAALVLAAALAAVSAAAQPLDTTFTYQGRLTDAGDGATGTYDFRFILYDAIAAGAQVGPVVVKDDVPVTAGLFTVTLDFGSVFGGAKRFLEIGVRPGSSSGAYEVLSPRQELTASPNALFSSAAGTAAAFSGSLAGDVTGTQGATVVAAVGGQTAASVAGGVALANAATPANTANAIVKRDGSGGFAAGAITADGLVVGTDKLVLAGDNVGVGTATPASRLEVAGDLIRTLVRAYGYVADGTDSGALASRVVTFTKKRADTGLRVTYTDNLRVFNNDRAGRWELRFDGSSCTNPGLLMYDLYNGVTGSFMHIPVTVTGTCFGLGAGAHTIQVYVGPSPGYPISDLYTGFNNQYWTLEVEEVR